MIGTLNPPHGTAAEMAELSRPGVSPGAGAGRAGSEAETSFALVCRAREGDVRALDELCARYLPRLQRWAHGRLPAWARGALDTHDLVQDTFARAIQRIDDFEPRHEGAFQAYLRQSILNRVRDEIRHAQRKPPAEPLASIEPASDPSPLEQAIGRETLDRYESALQRLRPEDREAIIARIEMGYTAAEVAEALGKPSPGAAQMAVSRALVRLAKEMARDRQ